MFDIEICSGMKGAFVEDDDKSRNYEKNLIEVVLDNEENSKKISASIEQNIHEKYWVSCQEGNVADVENYIKNMPSNLTDADIEGYFQVLFHFHWRNPYYKVTGFLSVCLLISKF